MSENLLGAPGDLQPQVSITFDQRASLTRTMNQPVIVDDPAGLVVFGDTTAIHLAEVVSSGAEVYPRLPIIKATTYIHGWTVSVGKIYVLDGVELSAWDISTGQKATALKLIRDNSKVAQANAALADLQKSIQKVEWATLLEQAEDEWLRLTAQQSAAAPSSDERDRLDTLATDFFRMLKGLREMTGSTGGSAAARSLITTLRQELADKRKATAQWCFSPPVVRRHAFDEPLRAIFIVQGDGTIHACDKPLSQSSTKKWRQQAELTIALMEDRDMFAYVGDNVLRTVHIGSFAEKGSWSPETAIAAGVKHTLAWANKQLWWGTDGGVYSCEVDTTGTIKPAFKSGPAWSTRQVGRLGLTPAAYDPPVNPNELFDTMKVGAWIAERTNPSAPLTDGMTAHLALSDESGKYTSPAEGSSYIVHGPFEGDTRSAASGWTQVKAHAGKPLVILSDRRGASVLCRYPTPGGVSQLVPHWSVVPWLSSVALYSDLDRELSREWPTPRLKQLKKPWPDMVKRLKDSWIGGWAVEVENALAAAVGPDRKLTERDIRIMLWYAVLKLPYPADFPLASLDLLKEKNKLMYVFFDDLPLLLINRTKYTGMSFVSGPKNEPGTVWEAPLDDPNFTAKFYSKSARPVNFDRPWKWKTPPTHLFHSAPPLWYDPWGRNRPGDFIPHQPDYEDPLDPLTFDGQLRFPQRPITLEGAFKGRSWAMFTDNDTASILANAKPATKPTTPDPVMLQAAGDPSALVVTSDEDRQRTTFQVLGSKLSRVTFDAINHKVVSEATPLGSTGVDVMTSPTVYKKASKTFPTAWCVVNPEFASTRLRTLAAVNSQTGISLWSKFLDDNKTAYGPVAPSKTWQIEKCPLPATALPVICLHGYNLPAAS